MNIAITTPNTRTMKGISPVNAAVAALAGAALLAGAVIGGWRAVDGGSAASSSSPAPAVFFRPTLTDESLTYYFVTNDNAEGVIASLRYADQIRFLAEGTVNHYEVVVVDSVEDEEATRAAILAADQMRAGQGLPLISVVDTRAN